MLDGKNFPETSPRLGRARKTVHPGARGGRPRGISGMHSTQRGAGPVAGLFFGRKAGIRPDARGRRGGYPQGMIGYVLASIVGLLLVALCFAGFGGSRARPGGAGKRGPDSQPAADEPTPDRSVTATPAEMDVARRHTPPA